MTFDDHAFEGLQQPGDLEILLLWDGAGIEKASCVVELDPSGGRQAIERIPYLRGNGAGRAGVVEGILPEVAHQAAPRAFTIRQEDRGNGCSSATAVGFV